MQAEKNDKIDFSKKKFLIVDDFNSFRSLLKRMLQSMKVSDIDETYNGEDAVGKMSIKRYDVILCDYNLGEGKDGQQVLEEAKGRGFIGYSTIFMMITAENTMEMVMGALEYQPDEYLMKPFNKSTLEKKLDNLYRKKENLRDIERAIVKEDYKQALSICNRLIDDNPRNLPELLKLKGEIMLKMGQNERAAEFFDKVLTMGDFSWAMLGLGKTKFNRADYPGAKAVFEALITKNGKITAAYDWLAKTLEKMGDMENAQQALMKAVEISPKAIMRQKELGNIAVQNKDYDTAARSLRSVVEQGRHSYLKSASDYTGLAKVLINLNNGEESVTVLNDALNEFAEDDNALLHINLARCRACSVVKDQQGAKHSLSAVVALVENSPEHLTRDMELELAQACFVAGDEKKGAEIVRKIVQNSHDDDALMDKVKSAFRDIGMEESGSGIVEMAREEVFNMNNEGVRLVREGDLENAIAYFEKAADNLKENKIINANAALAFIRYVQKHGGDEQVLGKIREYIGRVKDIDPSYKDLGQLQKMFKDLTPKFKSAWRNQGA